MHANWALLWGVAIEAFLLRALLFDVSLNTSRSWFNHREGRPWGNLFEVGTTAAGDKATRWLADKMGMGADHLRFLLWLLSLVLAAVLLVLFK